MRVEEFYSVETIDTQDLLDPHQPMPILLKNYLLLPILNPNTPIQILTIKKIIQTDKLRPQEILSHLTLEESISLKLAKLWHRTLSREEGEGKLLEDRLLDYWTLGDLDIATLTLIGNLWNFSYFH